MNDLCIKYGYSPDKEAIDRGLEMIAANIDKVISDDVLKSCFSFMDLTTLSTTDTVASVGKLMDKVAGYRQVYPDFPLPASVCVYPNLAYVVKDRREDESLHVTAVSGCFPTSQSFPEVKAKECEMAVLSGADEIDIVLALNKFMAEDFEAASNEIKLCREAIDKAAASQGRSVVLKVIIETGLLSTPERIAEASFLSMEAGADFIKTSTGKVDVNATPVAAYVMCECIKKYHESTGRKVGFKAAGGISNERDAVCYYSIVSTVLGKGWINKDCFRLGVSRLANSLISAVERKTVSYF